MKPQTIRILDVFLIGPAMIYAGKKLVPHDEVIGWGLALAGVATIAYNGRNYLLKSRGSNGNA